MADIKRTIKIIKTSDEQPGIFLDKIIQKFKNAGLKCSQTLSNDGFSAGGALAIGGHGSNLAGSAAHFSFKWNPFLVILKERTGGIVQAKISVKEGRKFYIAINEKNIENYDYELSIEIDTHNKNGYWYWLILFIFYPPFALLMLLVFWNYSMRIDKWLNSENVIAEDFVKKILE